MKRSVSLLLAGMLALSFTPMAVSAAAAEVSADVNVKPAAVNLFENEADWKGNKQGSTNPNCIMFEDGQLKFTPRYVIGTTYCARGMGEGKISFTYQITPDEYFDLSTEEGTAEWIEEVKTNQPFFGVMFYNSPVGVKPSGNLSIPFNEGSGGFPYMVAFDAEKQNSSGKEEDKIRNSQLGLTLRRYKYNGSHDYTRWSSVEPTNATYINSSGKPYESKIPDFNKPVTLADCFDGAEHSVDIDVKNLYVSEGDAKDAVQIEVYFDGELSLLVVDEMPFEGDGYNEFEDKRLQDGYISVYGSGGTESTTDDYYDYLITFKSFEVEFGKSNGGGNQQNTDPAGGGCGSLVNASGAGIGAAAGVVVIAGVAGVTLRKKKYGTKK